MPKLVKKKKSVLQNELHMIEEWRQIMGNGILRNARLWRLEKVEREYQKTVIWGGGREKEIWVKQAMKNTQESQVNLLPGRCINKIKGEVCNLISNNTSLHISR